MSLGFTSNPHDICSYTRKRNNTTDTILNYVIKNSYALCRLQTNHSTDSKFSLSIWTHKIRKNGISHHVEQKDHDHSTTPRFNIRQPGVTYVLNPKQNQKSKKDTEQNRITVSQPRKYLLGDKKSFERKSFDRFPDSVLSCDLDKTQCPRKIRTVSFFVRDSRSHRETVLSVLTEFYCYIVCNWSSAWVQLSSFNQQAPSALMCILHQWLPISNHAKQPLLIKLLQHRRRSQQIKEFHRRSFCFSRFGSLACSTLSNFHTYKLYKLFYLIYMGFFKIKF